MKIVTSTFAFSVILPLIVVQFNLSSIAAHVRECKKKNMMGTAACISPVTNQPVNRIPARPTKTPRKRPTKRPTTASPTTEPTSSPTPRSCSGVDGAIKVLNGHLYGVVAQQKTWPDAEAYAKTLTCCGVQGHLATVSSSAERTVMESAMGSYSALTWFGMVAKGGVWVDAGTEAPTDISIFDGKFAQGNLDGTGACNRDGLYYVSSGTALFYFAVEFDCA
jgi:hypothetical protein